MADVVETVAGVAVEPTVKPEIVITRSTSVVLAAILLELAVVVEFTPMGLIPAPAVVAPPISL